MGTQLSGMNPCTAKHMGAVVMCRCTCKATVKAKASSTGRAQPWHGVAVLSRLSTVAGKSSVVNCRLLQQPAFRLLPPHARPHWYQNKQSAVGPITALWANPLQKGNPD